MSCLHTYSFIVINLPIFYLTSWCLRAVRLKDNCTCWHIRLTFRWLTSRPHIAGSQRSREQAEHLAKMWEELGMTSHISHYDVMLSLPDPEKPNRRVFVQLFRESLFSIKYCFTTCKVIPSFIYV